ncbi:MAG: methyltransferase domain-containing protein, partial [Acidobacteriota bacterium]
LYRLPYHWFPEERLKRFEREEKQRILARLLDDARADAPTAVARHLDVGCGDGRWTHDLHAHLQRRAPDVRTEGVDFSARAIGFARLICPHLTFHVHTGTSLPFDDGAFDLVSAIEVIEHVPDDQERAFLRELRRVCAAGGLLLLTTPSWNLPLTHHHERHYDVDRLVDLIAEAGFRVIGVRGQSRAVRGRGRWLRKRMNWMPKVWKLWRFSYRERPPARSLNLMVVARAASA